MRDIQVVLERWGSWASGDSHRMDYYSIAAGFKGLLPQTGKTRPMCCDDDGLLIDSCVGKLKRKCPDDFNLIVLHYVFNFSKRSIAKIHNKDERLIRISLKVSENFIDGCLSMLPVELFNE
ncbi:antitermination protein Q [Serratia marcescens]|uniref:antiterminator Q family protein n=1 Tax=Serratia TaxID=613 RepID=UPI000B5E69A1|nr:MULTISPECIES: antiterminator Q family protein [Serratia]ASM01992.1 antitermination protein Q [Serratia marcescens]MBH2553801.1 antitermination protein Q [Serratia ureilytica]MBH3266273.1 antitermination protein Q [Serratia ureilytica]